MNKNILALAVAAAAFSGAVSAAQVYSDDASTLNIGGRIEARGNGVVGHDNFNDDSRVRVNIAGQTQINDDLYGLGFFEREFKSDKSDDENRYIYAGIGSKTYGQLVYGKTDGSLGMITDFTDIMEYFGNEAGGKINAADRPDDSLAYLGQFGGLTVRANYVFDADGTDFSKTNPNFTSSDDSGFSVGSVYNFNNGLAFGLGYGEQKQQEQNTMGNALTAKQGFASVSYTSGDFYVAGLYQNARNIGYQYGYNDTKHSNEYQGYELATAYTINKLVLRSTYNYMENMDSNAKMANALAFDGSYFFTPNFRTYAGYKVNLLDKNDVAKMDEVKQAADDQFVLGARYDF
ncbi:porin [Photobacterium damselae]|uniref:porin n=1 Tax=Photobacterium damselae TaxID=38293 RepID=UPI0018A36097|nr:porin [Photobacterium damselae]QOQ68210.1 porin [Photobacterium damselae subsp. damselae]